MTGPTSFPQSLDSFPDILATSNEDDVGFEHDLIHDWEMTAIAALQVAVGAGYPNAQAIMDQLVGLRSLITSVSAIATEVRYDFNDYYNNYVPPLPDPSYAYFAAQVFGS